MILNTTLIWSLVHISFYSLGSTRLTGSYGFENADKTINTLQNLGRAGKRARDDYEAKASESCSAMTGPGLEG